MFKKSIVDCTIKNKLLFDLFFKRNERIHNKHNSTREYTINTIQRKNTQKTKFIHKFKFKVVKI